MRAVLTALTDELRRLKLSGVRSVSVSDEAIESLRAAVASAGARAPQAPAAAPVQPAGVSPAVPRETGADVAAQSPRVDVVREPAPAPRPLLVPQAPAGAADIPKSAPPFSLPDGPKQVRWEALKRIVLEDQTCRAHVRPGKQVVLGVGTLDAKIFFCGEAPGAEEEQQGEPFVGPAGQLLNRMIGGMGLQREDVYIGNIMNWRPELPVASDGEQVGNRAPTEDEMRYCLPYLKAQVQIVAPTVIVALGMTATQGLLGFGRFSSMGAARGRWHDFGGTPVMATYHPSYLLRNASTRSKRMVWEDLLQVMERVGLPISDKQRGYYLSR